MAYQDAAVQWADKNGGNAKKVAVAGLCRGGPITWLYCAHRKAVKAGVAV